MRPRPYVKPLKRISANRRNIRTGVLPALSLYGRGVASPLRNLNVLRTIRSTDSSLV